MKPFSKDSSNYQIGHLKQVERLSASQIAKHLNISKRHVEKVLEEETSYLCLFRLRIEYLGQAYQNNSAPIRGWHRDVELGGDVTFHQLNDIIQQALGWDNSHLYAFAVKGNHYGYLGDDDFIVEDVFENYYSAKISLGASGLRKADTFVYEYDFGDRHLFLLTVLGSEETHNMTDLPKIVGLAGRDLIQYKTGDEEDAGQLFVSENPENEKKINAKMVLLSQETGSVREDMKKVDFIIEKDTTTLEQWRKSKDKRKWEVAVTLLENRSLSLRKISEKIERPVPLIRKWIRIFNYFGITGIKETLPLNQVSDEGVERGNAVLKTKRILVSRHISNVG